ncbi:MAG: type II toxin-antitoxin system HicB family antitoxin [Spirochaetaceae bacterium]|nr:type II toxin-antitoxin system HicB family antitoxin [Spirochaetaceae bacterium]
MIYYALLHETEEDEIGFWIEFPDLNGIATQGDTLEETLAMAEECLNVWLDEPDPEVKFNKPTNFEGQAGYYPINVKPNIALALKLRWVREEAKLTQSDVAKRLNISYQAYQKLESPSKNNATLKTIEKLQNALGVKLISI